jgi:hypothetical protein
MMGMRVGVSMILVESCCLGGASYKASLGGLRRIEQGLALPLMIHASITTYMYSSITPTTICHGRTSTTISNHFSQSNHLT